MEALHRQYSAKHRYGYLRLYNLFLPVLEYCWVLIVVLNGNSVYNANAVHQYYLLPLCVVFTIILFAAYLVISGMRILIKDLVCALCLCGYFLVYFVIKQNDMSAAEFAYMFVIGLPCLYLLFVEMHRRGRLITLFYKIENVIFILALISLFFWLFGTVLDILQPNMSTKISWGNYSVVRGYWGLHFEIQRDTTFGATMYRNSGIFTEAPMLNLWVNIALAIELFLREKTSKKRVIVFALTILTTMSTTGLIFLALCFLMKYFHGFKNSSKFMIVLLLFASIIIVFIIVYAIYSLLLLKSSGVSFAMRMSDYIGPIQLWLKHPIFGSGYANLRSLAAYIYSPSGALGFSNSIIAVLATGGIWVAAIFYYPHIATMITRVTNSKSISEFSICYFYLFCTTAFFGRYLAVVMIAFDLAILESSKRSRSTADRKSEGSLWLRKNQ